MTPSPIPAALELLPAARSPARRQLAPQVGKLACIDARLAGVIFLLSQGLRWKARRIEHSGSAGNQAH